jgi:N-acetylglucosaminyldiphosphoundecaprenol N-acetyl-beta-D-mannosaminyltransferase
MIFNKLLTDPKNVLQGVFDSIAKQEQQLITYLNQHCFNIYCENDVYRKILDKKFIVYQADVGVFLALKFLLKEKLKRIDATEMNKLILDKLIKENTPLVFVGGDFDDKFVQEESSKRGINLVKYQNGFFNEDQTENVINELNESNSQVFIIGMGVPKQEIFAAKLAQAHGRGTFICVGNFLEFYLGTKKRTHSIFRETGFEWLFRLITEPARLWKRYLIGIPLFIYRIFKIKSEDEILELQK